MTMTVEIQITGLALCFAKRDAWNAVFVCDEHHPVNFSADGFAPASLREIGKDREIVFSSKGLIDGLPKKGDGYKSIFNMAADYAHGPDSLVEKRSGSTDIVAMRVPSATVGTFELTPHDYYVQDAAYLGAPVEIIPPIAKIIRATFEVTNNLVMIVNDTAGPSVEPVFTFGFKEGETLVLKFDNDCGGNCVGNDFLDLYDIVEDKRGKRFVAGQVKRSYADVQNMAKSDGQESILNSVTGICDPVGIDPPPGP